MCGFYCFSKVSQKFPWKKENFHGKKVSNGPYYVYYLNVYKGVVEKIARRGKKSPEMAFDAMLQGKREELAHFFMLAVEEDDDDMLPVLIAEEMYRLEENERDLQIRDLQISNLQLDFF